MRVALFTGIALAMPVILYEVYAYVDPALRSGERRFILLLGPFILALFVGGMAFCYFLLLPKAIEFLFTFGSDVFGIPVHRLALLEEATSMGAAESISPTGAARLMAKKKIPTSPSATSPSRTPTAPPRTRR